MCDAGLDAAPAATILRPRRHLVKGARRTSFLGRRRLARYRSHDGFAKGHPPAIVIGRRMRSASAAVAVVGYPRRAVAVAFGGTLAFGGDFLLPGLSAPPRARTTIVDGGRPRAAGKLGTFLRLFRRIERTPREVRFRTASARSRPSVASPRAAWRRSTVTCELRQWPTPAGRSTNDDPGSDWRRQIMLADGTLAGASPGDLSHHERDRGRLPISTLSRRSLPGAWRTP